MAQQWQRGRRTKDIFLSPSEFKDVSRTWRELQRNSPFLAQLIVEGLSRKQIAARLKWSTQSLSYVLKEYRIGLDKTEAYKRIYKGVEEYQLNRSTS